MKIKQILEQFLPTHWDGRECVLHLKETESGNSQWKQSEWMGWFFESAALDLLIPTIGGKPGPFVGQTQFDYMYRNQIWDLKASAYRMAKQEKTNRILPLNNRDNTRKCIKIYGGYGAIIAEGYNTTDTDGSFQKWHNALKGEPSDFSIERIKRGAPSRARKKAFDLKSISLIRFNSLKELDDAIEKKIIYVSGRKRRLVDGTKKIDYKYMLDKVRARRHGLLPLIKPMKLQVEKPYHNILLHRQKAI